MLHLFRHRKRDCKRATKGPNRFKTVQQTKFSLPVIIHAGQAPAGPTPLDSVPSLDVQESADVEMSDVQSSTDVEMSDITAATVTLAVTNSANPAAATVNTPSATTVATMTASTLLLAVTNLTAPSPLPGRTLNPLAFQALPNVENIRSKIQEVKALPTTSFAVRTSLNKVPDLGFPVPRTVTFEIRNLAHRTLQLLEQSTPESVTVELRRIKATMSQPSPPEFSGEERRQKFEEIVSARRSARSEDVSARAIACKAEHSKQGFDKLKSKQYAIQVQKIYEPPQGSHETDDDRKNVEHKPVKFFTARPEEEIRDPLDPEEDDKTDTKKDAKKRAKKKAKKKDKKPIKKSVTMSLVRYHQQCTLKVGYMDVNINRAILRAVPKTEDSMAPDEVQLVLNNFQKIQQNAISATEETVERIL